MRNKKQLKIYLHDELLKKLKLEAIKLDISYSELVKRAVEEWFRVNRIIIKDEKKLK